MKSHPARRVRRLEIRPVRTDDLNGVIGLWQSCDLIRPWNDPSKDIARKLRVNPEKLSRFYQRLGFHLDEVVCYGKRLEDDL
jgi:hypothetical protein